MWGHLVSIITKKNSLIPPPEGRQHLMQKGQKVVNFEEEE